MNQKHVLEWAVRSIRLSGDRSARVEAAHLRRTVRALERLAPAHGFAGRGGNRSRVGRRTARSGTERVDQL
jgi:hypothetical protein